MSENILMILVMFYKEYVPVASRPRAITNKKKLKWVNIYRDILVL